MPASVLFDHVEQEIRILVLRRFGAIAFRICVGGDVEWVFLDDFIDVSLDIFRELGINFV